MDVRLVCRAVLRLTTAVALSLGLTVPVAAQQGATGTIRGQVTDAVTMRPLSGVQLSVPGSGRGALANASGQFLILNVPQGTATVRAEIIGYGTQEQQITVVAGQVAQADFRLSQAALELDAIVVTGTPGQTQRRAIGNSVSQFEAAAVTEQVPMPSVQNLLQARTPGLTLVSNGGGAGDGSQIRLRGTGSIEGRTEPVIYVDGVRIISGNQGGNCGNDHALHERPRRAQPERHRVDRGHQGPCGVDAVRRRGGGRRHPDHHEEGPRGRWRPVDGRAECGYVRLGARTPTTYWTCSASNVTSSSYPGCAGLAPGTVKVYHPMDENPNAMRGNSGSDDPNGAGRWDWNLSARGGGELFNFYVSAERGDEQGIFLNNYSQRTGGRANFGFTPSEKLSFNVNMGYSRTNVRAPLSNNSSNSILRNGYRGKADANYQYEVGFRNFGPTLANQWDLESFGERYTMGATVNYTPFKWFTNRLVLGLDNQNRKVSDFTGIDQTGLQPWGTTRSTGYTDLQLRDTHIWTVDYSGTINTDINEDYNSAFSGGMQLNARKYNLYGATGEGLVANNLNLVRSAAVNRGDQDFEEQTSLGFYVQEMVGFKNRLFATAAVRVDDNSAFGQNFSLVVYPKAQLSYVISDEDFFDYGFIDQLKLRAAWGKAGNPPDPFTADRTYSAAVTTAGDVVINQLRPSSYGNPDLKAETGSEAELGFESSMWGGRMGLDFTYYSQSTKDALVPVPDPRSSGFSGTHFVNVGEIKNKGIEILLTATPLYTRSVQWDATVALAKTSNELASWGERAAQLGRLRRVRDGAAPPPGLPDGWLLVEGRGARRERGAHRDRRRRHGCFGERVRGPVAADA